MERVPFHDRKMEIFIQYHVMLIRQSSDQILLRCYVNSIINLNLKILNRCNSASWSKIGFRNNNINNNNNNNVITKAVNFFAEINYKLIMLKVLLQTQKVAYKFPSTIGTCLDLACWQFNNSYI